jgi:transposase
MLLSIKTQLKLNNEQRVLMSKHAGIARFTYNWGLATWQALYEDGYKPNHQMLRSFFNSDVKTNPELSWLKEKGICQKVTEFAFEQLGDSYQRFFKGLAEYPKFKKKGKSNNSFTINAGGKPINVGGTRINYQQDANLVTNCVGLMICTPKGARSAPHKIHKTLVGCDTILSWRSARLRTHLKFSVWEPGK